MSDFLTRTIDKANGEKVEIRIGVPIQEVGGNGDWMCSYQIEGIGDGRSRVSMGVDAIQALSLAMIYVSTSLYYSKEYEEGKITWYGGMSIGDLGLPLSEEVREEVKIKMAAIALNASTT